jgi:hypothetical protein
MGSNFSDFRFDFDFDLDLTWILHHIPDLVMHWRARRMDSLFGYYAVTRSGKQASTAFFFFGAAWIYTVENRP